jgi:hypothetical protein
MVKKYSKQKILRLAGMGRQMGGEKIQVPLFGIVYRKSGNDPFVKIKGSVMLIR